MDGGTISFIFCKDTVFGTIPFIKNEPYFVKNEQVL